MGCGSGGKGGQFYFTQETTMGYAGYVSAKLPPPKPTEVQAALWAVSSVEALELLIKLIQNIAVNPGAVFAHKLVITGRLTSTAIPRFGQCGCASDGEL